MKPQIWEKFPEDLFKDVLARLPIATIIRLRTVCHQWNNLITSQSFSQYCAQVSQANILFYFAFGYSTLQKNNYKAIYDPSTQKWYNPNTFEIPALPVSSAGGLVCFFDFFLRDLYVCNPVTQSFKKLPAGSIRWGCHSGMTVNGSGGYRVLRISLDREYEIYDSATKNWGHLERLPEYIVDPTGFINLNSVSIDDIHYFHLDQVGIVSCNTSTRVWTRHFIQAPLHSRCLTLAESDGWIILVGMLIENAARFVCIWEVQKVTFLLKEVDRFPCSVYNYGFLLCMTCWGNKGLLLCWLRSDKKDWMVTYNIATRKWEMVDVPYVGKKHMGHVYGVAFQPCLTAMP